MKFYFQFIIIFIVAACSQGSDSELLPAQVSQYNSATLPCRCLLCQVMSVGSDSAAAGMPGKYWPGYYGASVALDCLSNSIGAGV